jgi:ABC-type Fe3+ transport system substrate-binding protein
VWYDPRTRSGGGAVAGYLLMTLGEDYLRKLFAQDIMITQEIRQQVEWLVRGRYPISLGMNASAFEEFQSLGLGRNVKPLLPDSQFGTRINIDGGSVMLYNRAPHPNAAKVYANWLLSRQGQTAWSRHTKECSRRLDVTECPAEKRLKPDRQYLDIDREAVRPFQARAQEIATEIFK